MVLSGNYAQSYAAKLARVHVVAAYPITPQTQIVEKIAEFVATGQLPAQYIKVESEHSAMQACISAAALGARTYTASRAASNRSIASRRRRLAREAGTNQGRLQRSVKSRKAKQVPPRRPICSTIS